MIVKWQSINDLFHSFALSYSYSIYPSAVRQSGKGADGKTIAKKEIGLSLLEKMSPRSDPPTPFYETPIEK